MFYFINPVQVLMVMDPINNASGQVLFHQRMFPLTNLLHFNDLTNLSPLLLWCQIVSLWQNTFAQISHRMILGEGKTTKEKKVYFLLILKTRLIVLVTLWYFKKVSTLSLLCRLQCQSCSLRSIAFLSGIILRPISWRFLRPRPPLLVFAPIQTAMLHRLPFMKYRGPVT